MREILFVFGTGLFGYALLCCRAPLLRKLGLLVFLLTSYLILYFLTGKWWAGLCAVGAWFFVPWFELFFRVRLLRLPLQNRLLHRSPPKVNEFPYMEETTKELEEAGFEFINNTGWKWEGMDQFITNYWHPEQRSVVSLYLCEQNHALFAFLTITSYGEDGKRWRTTNLPFSPTLASAPNTKWHFLYAYDGSFNRLLTLHHDFLLKHRLQLADLQIPDPEQVDASLEKEMREQIDHNVKIRLIALTGDGYFRYSLRGLFFLWKQNIKDVIRLS